MNDELKEILEGDYQFVLIAGDYYDCPSCNDGASLGAYTFWDEKTLLEEMLKRANKDKMTAIWVIDSWNGQMQKFSDIQTKSGGHKVLKMEFDLPSGHVIISLKSGKYELESQAGTVLYGNINQGKT